MKHQALFSWNVSYESSARQRIRMKHQALFSQTKEKKNIEVSSAAILAWLFNG